MRKVWLMAAQTAILGMILAVAASGQNTNGQIQGFVHDATGAVLVGASVTLTNTATGVVRTTLTDASGLYQFPSLPPGIYSVKAAAKGFTALEVTGLTLILGQTLPHDFTLQPGAVGQEVTVSGEAPQVNTVDTEVSQVVSEQRMDTLPVNSRQYLTLALLMPGTTQDSTRAFFPSMNVGGSLTFNSTGNIVDGTQNNWDEDGEPRQDIAEDAVEEFKLSDAQWTANLGVSTGGQVEVATKGGTNTFHGDGFEYFRNQALNARTAVETTNPAYQRNQFGGSVGGPIVKDKIFFFGAYEHTIEDDFYTINAVAPFAATMNGTFPSPMTDTLYDARVDWQISPSQSLFVREAGERNVVTCSGCGGTTSSFGGYDESVPRDSIVVGHTWVVSPTQVNDLRFQYAWGGYYIGPSGIPQSLSIWTQVGQFPADRVGPPRCTQTYSFPGFSYGGCDDQVSNESRTEFRDTYGFTKGVHQMQIGGNYDWMPYFYENPASPGTWTFPTNPTIWDPVNNPSGTFTAANLGVPTSYSQGLNPAHTPHPTHYGALFFNDVWRYSARLTLNYGLRWERLYNSSDEDIGEWSFPNGQTGTVNVVNPICPAGAAAASCAGIYHYIDPTGRGTANNKNFSPRVGFNWDIFGNGKQTIRGGFGIYFGNTRVLSDLSEYTNGWAPSVSLTSAQNHITYPAVYVANTNPNPFNGVNPATFISGSPQPLNVIANDARSPYAEIYSLGTQRALTQNMSLSVDGIYNFTVHDRLSYDADPEDPTLNTQLSRPDPAFNGVSVSAPMAKVEYTGVYVKLDKRFSNRTQFLVSYTYAHSFDDNPLGSVIDPYNFNLDNWGPSSGERRNSLVASGSENLPWGVVGGLIWTWKSQLPFTAGAGTDVIDNKNQSAAPIPGTYRDAGNRMDMTTFIADVNSYRAAWDLSHPTANLLPISASSLYNDQIQDIDARMSKTVSIRERVNLQLMAQAFNLLNHTQWGAQYGGARVTNATAGNFGAYTSTRPARQIELAARVTF